MNIDEIISNILPGDENARKEAYDRWMAIGKPLFSLGKLETVVTKMAGIKGTSDYKIEKKGLLIMCADNGVVEEGVTQTGQEVTAIVADNFTHHATSVCAMCDVAGVDVLPMDIGMAVDVPSVSKREHKVCYGTKNFAKEPAMTREEVCQALFVGMEAVRKCKEEGYDLLATGEMGIGNTTTSSAVASVLLGKDVEVMTGRGAGLSAEGLQRKIRVIKNAIKMHQPDPGDVVDILSKVGGLDIAGLTGIFLGGAIYHIPIIIDGFISSVAALCAVRLNAHTVDYMLASHVSKEPAGKLVLEALGLSPMLTCDMCLGEGSGAVAAIPVIEMGLSVYRQMGTFEDIQVERYQVLK